MSVKSQVHRLLCFCIVAARKIHFAAHAPHIACCTWLSLAYFYEFHMSVMSPLPTNWNDHHTTTSFPSSYHVLFFHNIFLILYFHWEDFLDEFELPGTSEMEGITKAEITKEEKREKKSLFIWVAPSLKEMGIWNWNLLFLRLVFLCRLEMETGLSGLKLLSLCATCKLYVFCFWFFFATGNVFLLLHLYSLMINELQSSTAYLILQQRSGF